MKKYIKKIIKNSLIRIGKYRQVIRKINAAIHLSDHKYNPLLFFNGEHFLNRNKDKKKPAGCNLYGYVFGEFGMGEHIKCIARACMKDRIPISIYNYQATYQPQNDVALAPYINSNSPHNTNIFCANNDTVLQIHQQNINLFKKRYNIGYGQWELSDYPNEWLYAMNLLDEIWAPTHYLQEIIAAKTSVPVLLMPLAVDFDYIPNFPRHYFNIPDDAFVFFFSFDFSSTATRKNPLGVIEAFKKAFPEKNTPCMLVLKCKIYREMPRQVEAYNQMLEKLKEIPHSMVIDQSLQRDEVLGLINCADCYVSLHRAEGYGFGMAEAMKMGKPVIATGFSGNLDFMNTKNSFLVDYQLVKVRPGEYFHMEGDSVWAEPDTDHAAYYMKKIVADSLLAKQVGVVAKQTIDEKLNFRTIGARYRRRLQFIDLL